MLKPEYIERYNDIQFIQESINVLNDIVFNDLQQLRDLNKNTIQMQNISKAFFEFLNKHFNDVDNLDIYGIVVYFYIFCSVCIKENIQLLDVLMIFLSQYLMNIGLCKRVEKRKNKKAQAIRQVLKYEEFLIHELEKRRNLLTKEKVDYPQINSSVKQLIETELKEEDNLRFYYELAKEKLIIAKERKIRSYARRHDIDERDLCELIKEERLVRKLGEKYEC